MSETSSLAESHIRQIQGQEIIHLEASPIRLSISGHDLGIIIPSRDWGQHGWNPDCLVVDPSRFDARRKLGLKGLRDGEILTIGSEATYGRFHFSHDEGIAPRHITIARVGLEITLTDLGSDAGTYIYDYDAR
jgi:hypothetical protein